ncbi:MAG: hypothetical protein RSC29_02425, partial [Oscillospiraceae bacterium]
IGGMFKDQPTIQTNAKFRFITEGVNTTEAGFLSDTSKLNDGYSQEGFYADSTSGNGECVANILADLNDVYSIDSLRFWTYNSATSKAENVEVLASTDGISYNKILDKAVKESAGNRPVMTELKNSATTYARFLKIIIRKKVGMTSLRIDEVAVYGSKIASEALNMSYTWDTEEPFGTKNDITWDTSRLTDGIYNEVAGTQGEFTSVVFDLKEQYQVGDIVVSANGLESMEAQFSLDGKKYFSSGYRIQNSAGVPGLNARYVKLIINKKAGEWLEIKEVDIEGYTIIDSKVAANPVPEKIPLRAKVKNASTIYFDWSGYNTYANTVQGYSLYLSENDFISVAGMMPVKAYETGDGVAKTQFNSSIVTYMGTQPNTDYYAAVVPILNDSVANENVEVIKFHTPSALGDSKVGGIFNINEYPNGGSSHVNHPDENANIEKKLKLLSKVDGINNSRWFNHDNAMLSRYAAYGINFHLFYDDGAVLNDNKLGKWTFSTGNEPEDTFTAAQYAEKIKTNFAALKAKSPNSLLCEPTLMGTEANKCLKYLDNLYKTSNDFKDNFDVIDVHPYSKKENGKPGGLPSLGMPELLPQKISDLRATMANNNDGNKPIIFSEIGWSTFNSATVDYVMVAQSRENQRDYCVRSYLHAAANDIKQVYWYCFQDEGDDFNDREKSFGLIDWNAKPKEAYYGYYIMSRILSESEFTRSISGLSALTYAYEFWDESRNSYVTAVWTASETVKPLNISANSEITMVKADGSANKAAKVSTLEITGTPTFIFSSEKLNITE